MAEHLTSEQVNAYGQHPLLPEELLTVDAHLTGCAACRSRIESSLPASTVALYADFQREATGATHLSFEQMAGCVDDSLNHAESLIVSDHLATCWQCAQAVKDLRNFAATDTQPRPIVESQTSWWERMRHWAVAPTFSWALAGLLLVVLAGWLMRTLCQRPANTPQFAQQGASPAPSPQLEPTPQPTINAPVLAQITDGGRQVTLDASGHLSGLETLSIAHQELVKKALTTQRLERPDALADLQRRGSSLMGADDEGHRFALQAPVGKVVLSTRPSFNWSPLEGATSYVVEIYDEQFNLVAQSEAISQVRWTPPRSLVRGKVYAWQVKATKDGQTITAPAPPAPQARFRVLDQAQANDIAQARQTYGTAHLLIGLLYARAGLIEESVRELRALQKLNPDSELVRKLLKNIETQNAKPSASISY